MYQNPQNKSMCENTMNCVIEAEPIPERDARPQSLFVFQRHLRWGACGGPFAMLDRERRTKSKKKIPRVTYSIAFTFTYVSSRLSLSLLKYPSNVPNSTPSPLTTSQSTSPSIPAKLL